MALKMTISPSVYEGLTADVKKEYKKVGEDYQLDLDGYEDPAELRRARDREKEEAAEAKRALNAEKAARTAAEKQARELEAAGKSVDEAVKAKETEWQTKYDTDTKKLTDQLTGLTNATVTAHKNAIADSLANKVSTAPTLLAPRIAERIEVEIDPATNTPKSYILKDGKRTAWTVDDLEKDILANKEYATILRGTKASGGGGAPSTPGGGGAPRQTHSRPGTPPDNLSTPMRQPCRLSRNRWLYSTKRRREPLFCAPPTMLVTSLRSLSGSALTVLCVGAMPTALAPFLRLTLLR
jgi:DNA uptake protein ComE-like DNA-binding protein